MNLPPVDGSLARDDSAPEDGRRDRVRLARKWAYLLSQTTYVPWRHVELERRLAGLVDELVAAVAGQPFTTDSSVAIGRRLVQWQLTDPASLRLSASLLGKGLLALPELRGLAELTERIVAVSSALAAGFAEQLRLFTLEQQETLNLALARAVQNAERDLVVSEAKFDRVAVCSPSGIAITDADGRFIRTNAALDRILGYSIGELEQQQRSLFELVEPARSGQLHTLYQGLLAGQANPPRQLWRLLCKDGAIATVSAAASPLLGADGATKSFVTVIEDVSELTLLQDELCRQALHDLLTGLPNRQYFGTRLEEALNRADPILGITVYLLDLDAFSLIATGLGRSISERLLVSVADRLKSVVDGESAMVARFDADQFAILVENSADTPDVPDTVGRITTALAEPVHLDGHSVAVSASIGVVHQVTANFGPADLIGAAELTLRRAQRNRRRRWELFDPVADRQDRETSLLAVALPGARDRGELTVSYQPMLRLADRRPVGVTARLRWQRPGGGVLEHARCVALAEQTGMLRNLGAWLLRSACTQFQQWSDQDLMLHLDLTVELAADPDLVDTVLGVCADTGLRPDRLCLGLPTAALVADGDVRHNFDQLAAVGVRVVAIGFGTVPGDLVGVEELSVPTVRIDSPRTSSATVTEVVSALVEAAHAAGALVHVADVSTAAQADWWRACGADVAQGEFRPSVRPGQLLS